MKKVILITAAIMLAAILGSCSKSESGAGDQVTVIFNAMEGVFASGESTLDTVVFAGDRIEAPAAPVRDGYTFDCWCVDSDGVTPVSFPALVNTDKIFYARWNVNPGKWLISGMSLTIGKLYGGKTSALYATYVYDDNNVLTMMTCVSPLYNIEALSATNIGEYSKRIPLFFKYDGDNVNVTTTTMYDNETDTVASMKLKDGQCQSMAMAYSARAEKVADMIFSYDAAGYLKGARLDTTGKTLAEWTDVNINDYSYSDFKMVYHDTTDAGKDTTWTTSVSYSNSDIRDITGCINVINPLFLSSLIVNTSEPFSEVNRKRTSNSVIPFLFTSPYFETPSTFIPKAFSISSMNSDGTLVTEILTLRGYNTDSNEGYIRYLSYYSPGDNLYVTAEFIYTEKK